MIDIKHQIDPAVNAVRGEIVSFIQSLVQSPSLANDEGPVQKLISEKLDTLGLSPEKVPIRFDELKDHPAFNDDGYSPDSRHNVVGHFRSSAFLGSVGNAGGFFRYSIFESSMLCRNKVRRKNRIAE